MIYLEVILWWLIVPTLAIVASCGIWNVISYCRHQYQLAKLWDDKTGAGSETPPTPPWAGRTTPHGEPGPGTYPKDAA